MIWKEAACGSVDVGTKKREGCGRNSWSKILSKCRIKDKDVLSTATMHRISAVEGRRTLKTVCSNPFILLLRD